MDLSLFSLLVLIAVIVAAYITKLNIGLLALAVAILLSRFGGIKDSAMYGGINLNVFWTLIGIYFFGQCMTQSGTLSLFAKKLIAKLPVKPELWLDPSIDDFYKFDNSKDMKHAKVKNYKHMGKLPFKVTQ